MKTYVVYEVSKRQPDGTWKTEDSPTLNFATWGREIAAGIITAYRIDGVRYEIEDEGETE